MEKICTKCEILKNLEEFTFDKRYKDNKSSRCKSCDVISRSENKKRIKEYCESHKEERILYGKKRYKEKRLEKLKYQKDYQSKNKESIKLYQKSYREKNKEKLQEANREYRKNKKETDDLYNLKAKIKTVICKSFSRNKFVKKEHTENIIGCTYKEFFSYIESKFESWMNWDNRGLYNGTLNYGWDIDHIIPLSTAKNEEDVIKLNHYTNLQPLCSYINRNVKIDKLNFTI